MPDFHPTLSNSKVLIDSSAAFLLWTANNFDVAATAHALGIEAVALQRVVDDELWVERVAPIVSQIKSQKPGDFSRAVNRAVAFVQGHRLRLVCERVITVMTNWSNEEMLKNLLPENVTKAGLISTKISTRFLGDIASACEKANSICFQALSDSAPERSKRQDSVEVPVLDVHAAIAKAMTGVSASLTPRNLLLNSQLEVAESIAQQAAIPRKPVPPPDDTFEGDQSGG